MAPVQVRHDARYEQLANHALKRESASSSTQPSAMSSAFLKHHASHDRKVRFDVEVVDNMNRPRKTVSPVPRPDSPLHPAEMSKLARKVSVGTRRRPGTPGANTSRPISPPTLRPSTSNHSHGVSANTSAGRDKASGSTYVVTKRDHGIKKDTSTSSRSSTYRHASAVPSSSRHSYLGSVTSANISSKRASGPPHRLLGRPPSVPEAPRRQEPPPTPRPGRLSTPDLDDISYRQFCACNTKGCRGYEYSHDSHGKPVSKMNAQGKSKPGKSTKAPLTIRIVQAAEAYIWGYRK